MYSCHSGANQEFAVANNRIWYQDTNSELLCLSARKGMPGVSYELYYKPMSWDGSKAAVLLMNTSIVAQPHSLFTQFHLSLFVSVSVSVSPVCHSLSLTSLGPDVQDISVNFADVPGLKG